MARLIWSPAAENDLRELAHYIGVQRQSPQGARNLVDGIREKCELVSEHPETGERRPDLGEDLRIVPAGTRANPRNFVVIYRPIDGGIEVVRVFRASQDYPNLF